MTSEVNGVASALIGFAKKSPWIFYSAVLGVITLIALFSYSLADRTEWRCALKAKWFGLVPDRLATYVIVGYGDKPFCPMPNSQLPHQIAVGAPLTIWVRAVHFDHLNLPSEPLKVDFEIINVKTGAVIPMVAPQFLLNPTSISTRKDDVRGFSYGFIVFTSSERNIFRVRAKYLDAELPSYSLGPPIVVF